MHRARDDDLASVFDAPLEGFSATRVSVMTVIAPMRFDPSFRD
jgi:hypothetical protein